MKQKDIGLLVVIAIVSGVISLLISNTFLSPASDRASQVEVVTPLQSDFERPPREYFNDDANNPTKTIRIGEDPNEEPFGNE